MDRVVRKNSSVFDVNSSENRGQRSDELFRTYADMITRDHSSKQVDEMK